MPTEGEVSVTDREDDVRKDLNRGRCQSVSRNERRYSQSIESEPGKTDRHQIPAALMSQPEFRLYPKGPVCPSPCYWGQVNVALTTSPQHVSFHHGCIVQDAFG